MDPITKRVKTEPNGKGKHGRGDDGGQGGSGLHVNESSGRPSNLVLVGRILNAPSPKFQRASGGKMLIVHVETWMTDLYRSSQWWVELPNVDDVADANRRKVMVKVLPIGAPAVASLVAITDGSQGRMRLEGIHLALFEGESGDKNMIFGAPPAWFKKIWKNARRGSCEQTACEETGHNYGDTECVQLADEFEKAKIYVTRAEILRQQRDWLVI